VTPPFSDAYGERIDERGGVLETVTEGLLFLSLTLWAIFWGGIWLLSGLFVALHIREDFRLDPEKTHPRAGQS